MAENSSISKAQLLATIARLEKRIAVLEQPGGIPEQGPVEEAEENYRLLIEQIQEPVTIYDRSGATLIMNRVSAKLLGGQPTDFIGKSVADYLPDQAAYIIERNRKIIQTGRGADFVDKFELASGTKWFWSILQPIRNASGDITAVQTISHDITERKMAEDELFRLRNLMSNFINSMPSVLIGVDPTGHVTLWNRQAEKETGISADDAQGRIVSEVHPGFKIEMHKVLETISEGIVQRVEKIALPTESETRFADMTIYPLIPTDIEGAVIRIDDVTERVRIQEMMIQSEKMLSIGALAAGMAHEINNPLAGIIHNLQVIRARLKDDMKKNLVTAKVCGTTMETIAAYTEKRGLDSLLDAAMSSGLRAAKIVHNMLSFSRKSDSRFAHHSVSELLDNTLELASNDYDLKRKYDFRKIELVKDYQSDLPKILCAGSEIQQVFLNILKNGAHAMTENVQTPAPPRFSLSLKRDGNKIRIAIGDNGPGMDEQTERRLFEPFFTTKEANMGTGLGLSISYYIIVENHGGSMTVESSPGEGATFVICLPLERTP